MTIAVDWDVKHRTKPNQSKKQQYDDMHGINFVQIQQNVQELCAFGLRHDMYDGLFDMQTFQFQCFSMMIHCIS